MHYNRSLFAGKRFVLTMFMAVAAFVLLTGQFCAKEQPAAPAPVATATTQAGEPVEMDTRNLTVEVLNLADANGKIRAVLNTDESGAPGFTFLDVDGNARSRISLDGNGNPFIDLYNNKGEILSSYWVENDAAFLTYRDKDGNPQTIIPREAAAPARQVTTSRPVGKAPTATSSTSSANANFVVYYNSKSPRYHLRSCKQLTKGSNKFEITVAEATAKGMNPCKDCRPPILGMPGTVRSTVPTTGENRTNIATPAGVNNPTVYYNSKSKKYHVLSCAELKEGKNRFPIGMNEAKAQGYWPCPKCRPPQ